MRAAHRRDACCASSSLLLACVMRLLVCVNVREPGCVEGGGGGVGGRQPEKRAMGVCLPARALRS